MAEKFNIEDALFENDKGCGTHLWGKSVGHLPYLNNLSFFVLRRQFDPKWTWTTTEKFNVKTAPFEKITKDAAPALAV